MSNGLGHGKTYHIRQMVTTNISSDNYKGVTIASILNKVKKGIDSSSYLQSINQNTKSKFRKYFNRGYSYLNNYSNMIVVRNIEYNENVLKEIIYNTYGHYPDSDTEFSIDTDTRVSDSDYIDYCLQDPNFIPDDTFKQYVKTTYPVMQYNTLEGIINLNGNWYLSDGYYSYDHNEAPTGYNNDTYEYEYEDRKYHFTIDTNTYKIVYAEKNVYGQYSVNTFYRYYAAATFVPFTKVTKTNKITDEYTISNKVKNINRTTVSTYTGTYEYSYETYDEDGTITYDEETGEATYPTKTITEDETYILYTETTKSTLSESTTEADTIATSYSNYTTTEDMTVATEKEVIFLPENPWCDKLDTKKSDSTSFIKTDVYLSSSLWYADLNFKSYHTLEEYEGFFNQINDSSISTNQYTIATYKYNGMHRIAILQPPVSTNLIDLYNYKLLSTYPILTLRENRRDLQTYKVLEDYEKSSTHTDEETTNYINTKNDLATNAPWITEDRYYTSDKLLDIFSLSVSDLYDNIQKDNDMSKILGISFILGITPDRAAFDGDNDDQIVSKALYLTFKEFISNSKESTVMYRVKQMPYQCQTYFSLTSKIELLDQAEYEYEGYCTSSIEDKYTSSESGYDDGAYYIPSSTDSILTVSCQISKTEKKTFVATISYTGDYVSYASSTNAWATISYSQEYKYKAAYSGWKDENLVIPLLPEVVNQLNPFECIKLYGYTVKIQLEAYERKHVSWWKSWGAQFVMGLVTIILIIISWYLPPLWGGTAAAAQAGGAGTAAVGEGTVAGTVGGAIGSSVTMKIGALVFTTTAATKALIGTLITIASSYVLSNILNNLFPSNPILNTICSVVASIAMSYAFGDGFSLDFDAGTIINLTLTAGNIAETYVNSVNNLELKKLQEQQEEFEKLSEERSKTLDAALDDLNDSVLSPEFFTNINLSSTSSLNSNNGLITSTLFKPSALFYLTHEAHLNKDVLYGNTSLNDRDNALSLTIGD